MKKQWMYLGVSALCLFFILLLQYEKTTLIKDDPPPLPSREKRLETRIESGNTTIKNFDESKRILKKLYRQFPYTFYCGCYFSDEGIDFASCGYKVFHDAKRAKRVEWEHIVPASDFGRSFVAWREGDARCRDRKGRLYRGRKCARLVSERFNRMEADLYNLVPAVGEVNGVRKDYPMGLLPGVENTFGACATKIANNVIEPREKVRGFIARTYKYMDKTYSGHGIVSRKNEKLFDAWDKQYPPDEREKQRARQIAEIQGNINFFVEGYSKFAEREEAKGRASRKP